MLAFALASLVIIVIPGPSVLFVIGRSLALGRRAGILSVLGNELGAIPLIVAVALGIGAVVAQSVVAFTVIKIVGAAYLAYLGIQAIRHRHDRPTPADRAPRSAARIVWQGFMVGLLNPKTIVFFVAVLPQFVDYRQGNIPVQMMFLGLVFVTIAFVSDGAWAFAAGTARAWFATSERRMSRIRGVGGAMMIGLSGALLLTGASE